MPGFEIFGAEEKQQVLEVLESGVLFRYEFAAQRKDVWKVLEFERAFAAYTGAAHAQAVTSGTAALKVALVALGVGAGDEVITQGFTFVATWEAILDCGAVPVFTEVDLTFNMDPADLEKKITSKTKAIIPVHMMGAQARIEEIKAIADRHNIPVIEDTAQAAGGRLNGRHLGSFGAIGTFSFDAVKTMTTGEGGMCITSDEKLWQRMSEYHDHGHDHVPNPGGRGGEGRPFIGFNYRMMEIQGAIGLAQLAKLDGIVAAQKKNKAFFQEAGECATRGYISVRSLMQAAIRPPSSPSCCQTRNGPQPLTRCCATKGWARFGGVKTAGTTILTGSTCSKVKPTATVAGLSAPTANAGWSMIRRLCLPRRQLSNGP